MVTYGDDVLVDITPFTAQPDGEEVIIGNPETGVFLAIPPAAVELLQNLAEGKTLGRAAELYEQKYGEKPDLDDFLSILEAKGFVQASGAEAELDAKTSSPPQRRYHFANFPQSLARRLLSAPVLVGCFILICLTLILTFLNPSLKPSPYDIVFPDRRALSWVLIIIADLFGTFIHEFAHLIAARAQGVKSRMGMSHRLWNLVAETDLTGLWAVPKRQRYLPMLAGMLTDAISGSVLILIAFAQQNHLFQIPLFYFRLIRALTFGCMVRIVWEFFLFMRTDVYYVITTYFNCKNLMADTEVYIQNQLSRFFKSIPLIDQSALPSAEMKVVQKYAYIWVIGRIWALFMLLWVTIPVSVGYVRDLSRVFRTGYSADRANFVDAILMAAIFLVPTTAGLVLWICNLIKQKRSS
jgi:putative peptide zinc metalloprotease protein